MNVKATDRCQNCGCEFADHQYVPNSITRYTCPHPYVESVYGFFHGGDPRDFHPDYESCSKQEIDNHKLACELWDECEERGETPTPETCKSGLIYDDNGEVVGHVLRSPYGIGIYTMKMEQFFDAVDHDYEDDEQG